MGDFRTDLERSIDEVLMKYAVNHPKLQQLIENGELSVLNAKYSVDFDYCTDHWCFRSGKMKEITKCNDYDDQYFYSHSTKSIKSFIVHMMSDVSSAVNNVNNSYFYLNACQSYSKFLAAPLFKYTRGNGPLIIDELKLNSLDINVAVDCFDWIGENAVSYDIYGQKQERYHIEYFDLSILFKELFSKKMMLKRIYDELSPVLESRNSMMDVDNITISIPGVTLDISEVNRNSFDRFHMEHGISHLKRHASYKKDKEVLTTRKKPSYQAMVIQNPRVIETVRFIYLLKIGNWYTEKSKALVAEIINLDEYEGKAIQWILDYLGTDKAIWKEREVYYDTFGMAPPLNNGEPADRNKFVNYFRRLECFKKEFGEMLLSQAIDH
ncbi:hypothetical protein QIH01_23230 [Brevibacillus brevis]|nr:hypothetical protein QIH01_23230 [Brevibacillus brevis]